MDSEVIKISDTNREEIFNEAYNGSYYTITGCGGNLEEWVNGYIKELEKLEIGKPIQFMTFKGSDMNVYYNLHGNKAYQDDLTFLMFPLDNLHMGKLVVFKLRMGDRWFDDIIDNNKPDGEEIED
ncbi:MAG: hypothetical protein J1E16_00435 [Muribaculaceae bacterium]|nr:hypothetical protein [Muribaculaceae bacterium]